MLQIFPSMVIDVGATVLGCFLLWCMRSLVKNVKVFMNSKLLCEIFFKTSSLDGLIEMIRVQDNESWCVGVEILLKGKINYFLKSEENNQINSMSLI